MSTATAQVITPELRKWIIQQAEAGCRPQDVIEAMKTMNPIPAPRAGRILEFLVANGQPVEFGEPLVIIG
jgi:acetyl/propionyl-CoA carboxylase alpha subunit